MAGHCHDSYLIRETCMVLSAIKRLTKKEKFAKEMKRERIWSSGRYAFRKWMKWSVSKALCSSHIQEK
ncbi:unnamed protein product [Dovyalis caffra]|uniref:Uncharacterized protein n=1 Tax=Dovyalis caffra TaxID=77055 RepID=A0AAV1RIX1_9ROSI|nr:unnamed protein product [Dovyalis caffra]